MSEDWHAIGDELPVTPRQTTQTNLKMADFLLEENFFEEILTNPGYFGIWHRILGYLDFQTLLRCQQVSKNFKAKLQTSFREFQRKTQNRFQRISK